MGQRNAAELLLEELENKDRLVGANTTARELPLGVLERTDRQVVGSTEVQQLEGHAQVELVAEEEALKSQEDGHAAEEAAMRKDRMLEVEKQ